MFCRVWGFVFTCGDLSQISRVVFGSFPYLSYVHPRSSTSLCALIRRRTAASHPCCETGPAPSGRLLHIIILGFLSILSLSLLLGCQDPVKRRATYCNGFIFYYYITCNHCPVLFEDWYPVIAWFVLVFNLNCSGTRFGLNQLRNVYVCQFICWFCVSEDCPRNQIHSSYYGISLTLNVHGWIRTLATAAGVFLGSSIVVVTATVPHLNPTFETPAASA